VLVDELVRGGVTEAVLSPGSRNAPLSFALHEADAAGRLRLHVRIDERTAGFLALGLAKASGRPVVVACTSGTAAANLHPAVLEASSAGVPLVVLTADRPAEMRGVGANQTADQVRLYGGAVRLFAEIPAPESRPGQVAGWRALAARAVVAARGRRSGDPGPVHLDVALREPLVPDEEPTWWEPLDGRGSGRAWTRAEDRGHRVSLLPAGPRTVVVAGDGAGSEARTVAEAASWPLLAEPSSGARSGPNALAAYRLLLEHLGCDIERVVVFGRPTLSRPVTTLLSREDVELVVCSERTEWPDVGHRAALVTPRVAPEWVEPGASRAEPDAWLARWLDADRAARAAVRATVDDTAISGIQVAREVASAVPVGGLLVVGSSNPIRDVDLADPWDDPLADVRGAASTDDISSGEGRLTSTGQRVLLANRGLSGIDGTVSTAIGAALAHAARGAESGPAYALMGDLTFLHDSTGLVIGPEEPRPDLCIVVVNDDGGGIFGLLEQGGAEHAHAFERIFGTPTRVDLAALCAATGTAHVRAETAQQLHAALAPEPGIRVVEVPVDRTAAQDLHARLRAAVAEAVR
jgi:2-succinyl-5-enolpyruvyl-6-hydroxy-3-cyclohexene-1-carboxylate synthase